MLQEAVLSSSFVCSASEISLPNNADFFLEMEWKILKHWFQDNIDEVDKFSIPKIKFNIEFQIWNHSLIQCSNSKCQKQILNGFQKIIPD